MDRTSEFELERPRLTRVASRILANPVEAEDVVQQAWLRLDRADAAGIDSLPAWLTTVVTRLCLDRLGARIPEPGEPPERPAPDADPADETVLVDEVGGALAVVLERLTPTERVAFVLHESFGVDFAEIGEILDRTPAAARKLASRARTKVAVAAVPDARPDWLVVDAFLDAARGGDLSRILALLAPDVMVSGDAEAVAVGTPERIVGRTAVAAFFDGAAASALPVFVGDRPGAAWFDRGVARVVFDFHVVGGEVSRIDFRADPGALASLRRRRDGAVR